MVTPAHMLLVLATRRIYADLWIAHPGVFNLVPLFLLECLKLVLDRWQGLLAQNIRNFKATIVLLTRLHAAVSVFRNRLTCYAQIRPHAAVV